MGITTHVPSLMAKVVSITLKRILASEQAFLGPILGHLVTGVQEGIIAGTKVE